jgi:pimeloyl-ACP methyl ester carboxylesterase
MQFHSGFSLTQEEELFREYIKKSDFTICGFSYGAIAAQNATIEALKSARRIDTLQLFSPAFFQTKEEKFKRLQLRAYMSNETLYMRRFIDASFLPYEAKILKHKETNFNELQELLNYVWSQKDLHFILSKGVKIEVYLGGKDAIIDVAGARDFFINFATITYIKDANHFLQLS